MKKIFIITGWSDVENKNPFDRLSYVAKIFSDNKYVTTLITSNFDHHSRKFRDQNKCSNLLYTIKLIKEIGYNKNISVRRIISHLVFAKNIKVLLNNLQESDKPDIIYVTMPFTFTTLVCKKYCNRNNIPLVVDVIDLWPEAFIGITSIPQFIAKVLVYPWQFFSNKAYRSADALISHNYTYLNRALKETKKSIPSEMVYLGTDVEFANRCLEKYGEEIIKKHDEFWIAYVGGLAENYDLDTIIYAVKILKDKGIHNIKVLFLGAGTYENKLKDLAEKNAINYLITGRIEYSKLIAYLCKCDIAINAIKNSIIVISYKTNDYLSAGLPIINSSKGELQELLDKYGAGLYYETADSEMLAKRIQELYKNKDLLNTMKKNSSNIAMKILDKDSNYIKVIKLVDAILKK